MNPQWRTRYLRVCWGAVIRHPRHDVCLTPWSICEPYSSSFSCSGLPISCAPSVSAAYIHVVYYIPSSAVSAARTHFDGDAVQCVAHLLLHTWTHRRWVELISTEESHEGHRLHLPWPISTHPSTRIILGCYTWQ